MQVKKVLKFYFSAERIDERVDKLILKYALDAGRSCERSAERICELIEEKRMLSSFWGYLDGIISRLSERERTALKFYAYARQRLADFPEAIIREVRRSAVKFSRRAKNIDLYERERAVAEKYYAVTGSEKVYLSGLK